MNRLLAIFFLLSGSALTQQTPASTGMIATPEVDLAYETYGTASNATPVIVANGGPGLSHIYMLQNDVWTRLSRNRQIVFYDQRGNGRSGALRKGESCTLADQIQDLDALRERLGVERFDLLGHSWGGYLVMAYAARHPEHVAHLVIADSAAPKWGDTEFIFKYVYPEAVDRQGRLDFADGVGDPSAAKESLHEYMQMLFLSDAKRAEFMSRIDSYRYTRPVNEALNADLAKYDLTPVLPTLAMPTLVLTGRYDFNVAPSTAWKIHRLIPGSRWEVFEHSGHLPYFEEPDRFVQVVESFLGAPDRAPSPLSDR